MVYHNNPIRPPPRNRRAALVQLANSQGIPTGAGRRLAGDRPAVEGHRSWTPGTMSPFNDMGRQSITEPQALRATTANPGNLVNVR